MIKSTITIFVTLLSLTVFAAGHNLEIRIKNIRGVDENFKLTSELHETQLVFPRENYTQSMKSGVKVKYQLQEREDKMFFVGYLSDSKKVLLKDIDSELEPNKEMIAIYDDKEGHMVELSVILMDPNSKSEAEKN